jgi:hypothetical protein
MGPGAAIFQSPARVAPDARINRVFTPVLAVPGILLLSLIESVCVLPTPPPS